MVSPNALNTKIKIFKLVNLKGKDLIEFGCGIFPSSFGLKKKCMPREYVASDTSNKILKVAKMNDNRPTYKVIDLEKNITISKKYDLIILKGVLHHLKKPEKVLAKLKNILKPNGMIIISEPNLSSVIGNFLKWFLEFFFKKIWKIHHTDNMTMSRFPNQLKKQISKFIINGIVH